MYASDPTTTQKNYHRELCYASCAITLATAAAFAALVVYARMHPEFAKEVIGKVVLGAIGTCTIGTLIVTLLHRSHAKRMPAAVNRHLDLIDKELDVEARVQPPPPSQEQEERSGSDAAQPPTPPSEDDLGAREGPELGLPPVAEEKKSGEVKDVSTVKAEFDRKFENLITQMEAILLQIPPEQTDKLKQRVSALSNYVKEVKRQIDTTKDRRFSSKIVLGHGIASIKAINKWVSVWFAKRWYDTSLTTPKRRKAAKQRGLKLFTSIINHVLNKNELQQAGLTDKEIEQFTSLSQALADEYLEIFIMKHGSEGEERKAIVEKFKPSRTRLYNTAKTLAQKRAADYNSLFEAVTKIHSEIVDVA